MVGSMVGCFVRRLVVGLLGSRFAWLLVFLVVWVVGSLVC